MTSTTDVPPPVDDSGLTSERSKNSRHRPNRLNQALAWVGIAAGGLFIVAAIFFSGFFLSWGLNSPGHHHLGPATMACCSHMKPNEHMKPGAMMGPGPHSPTTAPSAPRP